jgi:hypothetical protein
MEEYFANLRRYSSILPGRSCWDWEIGRLGDWEIDKSIFFDMLEVATLLF